MTSAASKKCMIWGQTKKSCCGCHFHVSERTLLLAHRIYVPERSVARACGDFTVKSCSAKARKLGTNPDRPRLSQQNGRN